ncbi:14 kDa phosphohistidine phosphatase-like [Ylistrum balloti]|uniref:14 kDa phosphohistidine phosphatase-like n=1 Tax=Ylistrum balloti TaxID=509963 RepID=UPI002905D49D|nr:14 kDa phosphohistidine phosphatase-like [Ylistrum balloti]
MAGVNPVATASPGAAKNCLLKTIPDVEIDTGKFKYILVKVHDPAPEKSREYKHIVRGSSKAAYHADIYELLEPIIEEKGLDCECVGGGRIEHDASSKKIKIYGYSQAYGKADHTVTYLMLQRKYGSDYNVTFNNDGY